MKIMVHLEVGNRTVTEQVCTDSMTRQEWRNNIAEIASRIELSTYGPPAVVDEFSTNDQPHS